MSTKRIVVMRHGEKDGDVLAAYGAQQVWAAVLAFILEGFRFQFVAASGVKRTWQAAMVALAALDLRESTVRMRREFDFKKTVEEVFGPGGKSLHELPAIKAAGGMVANALEQSAYARLARERVTDAIRVLALEMSAAGEDEALVLSSSPYFECAGNPSMTPYSLGECDAVIFSVNGDDGSIISTQYWLPPLPGKAK